MDLNLHTFETDAAVLNALPNELHRHVPRPGYEPGSPQLKVGGFIFLSYLDSIRICIDTFL